MNPQMLIIKTMIRKPPMNCHYFWSTNELCGQLMKYVVNSKTQTLASNYMQRVMGVQLKPSNCTHEPMFLLL